MKQTASSPSRYVTKPRHFSPSPSPTPHTPMLFPASILYSSTVDSLCCHIHSTPVRAHSGVSPPGTPSVSLHVTCINPSRLSSNDSPPPKTSPKTSSTVDPRPANPRGLALCPHVGYQRNSDFSEGWGHTINAVRS